MEMTNEEAIEALYTIRAYYASLTAGYPKGKDCRGIGDVMCSEIANSCLMAIKALSAEPCEDCISREAYIERFRKWAYSEYGHKMDDGALAIRVAMSLPSVTPQPKMGRWINAKVGKLFPSNDFKCSECGNVLDFNGVNCGRGDANYCPNCGAKMQEVEE